jgi:hypothetical protein
MKLKEVINASLETDVNVYCDKLGEVVLYYVIALIIGYVVMYYIIKKCYGV